MTINDFTTRPEAGATYAKNTVPLFTISGQGGVRAVLTMDGMEVFQGSYSPDFTGLVSMDFSGLYDEFLSSRIPTTGATSIQQNAYRRQFTATFYPLGESIPSENPPTLSWYVANSMLKSDTPFQDWVKSNYLTNQPIEKQTNYEAPEWLTWLDLDGRWKLKVRFYPKNGGHVDLLVSDDGGNAGCYSADVSYRRMIQLATFLPNSLLGYYDLMLFDHNMDAVAVQRYIYEERTGREKYYCFINALGGIDTLICQGDNILKPDIRLKVGRFGDRYIQVKDEENTRVWLQNTGYFPENHKNHLFELLTQCQGAVKYEASSRKYYEIVLNASGFSISDAKPIGAVSFEYLMASVDNLVADTERPERVLHQSQADQSEEMDDLTAKTVMEFEDDGQGGYTTESLQLYARRIYVNASGNGTITCVINEEDTDTFDPGSDRMPFVIDIKPGNTVRFTSETAVTDSLAINYYPVDVQQQSAYIQTES